MAENPGAVRIPNRFYHTCSVSHQHTHHKSAFHTFLGTSAADAEYQLGSRCCIYLSPREFAIVPRYPSGSLAGGEGGW